MEFDMIGYDPSMVNALRRSVPITITMTWFMNFVKCHKFEHLHCLHRLLLSDVPSMAIEKVHMYQNTSIMQVTFLISYTLNFLETIC